MRTKTRTLENRLPYQRQAPPVGRNLTRQIAGLGASAELGTPSAKDTRAFSNSLLPVYDLLFRDWPAMIRLQNKRLGAWIEHQCGTTQKLRILDPTSGIGTQAIALAQRGHKVFAADVSATALVRSKTEAAKFNLAIHYTVADMRDLRCFQDQVFDAAVSMGNSLCVFLTLEDLACALRQVHRKLCPGGYFFAGIRDYRQSIVSRSSFDGPMCCVDAGGRRMAHQMWIWLDDRRYQLNIYMDRQVSADCWESQVFRSVCRAILPDELEQALRVAGFRDIEWLSGDMPASPNNAIDHGFDELVVSARR
jgi:SAM-dependent methyltransferase